ncbi:hypothetical protein HBE96_05100 [Clostridium sp. P21]|uniref:Uncharacterized protein n=1 Tax=Clostridium muellerianum TaxID=2716538 RepID=A0A7Y0EEU7_9CLOT|nr:hypothetical protein [Clostridium muellerianum]NMM62076.1 hypothetical protein [Clostridium muellerianum]
MNTTLIVTMAAIGISAAVAEKLLNAFGKVDMAQFVNIAGLSGIGVTALGIVIKLLQACTSIL